MYMNLKSLILLAIYLKHTLGAEYVLTLNTDDIGGDSMNGLGNKPLIVHIDPSSVSPEFLEQLSTASNVVFADLPELPHFINMEKLGRASDAQDGNVLEMMNQGKLILASKEDNQELENLRALIKDMAESGKALGCPKKDKKKEEKEMEEDWEEKEKEKEKEEESESEGETSDEEDMEEKEKEQEKKKKKRCKWGKKKCKKDKEKDMAKDMKKKKARKLEVAEPVVISGRPVLTGTAAPTPALFNATNMTGADYNNASGYLVPTTIFTAIALTVLIFLQAY